MKFTLVQLADGSKIRLTDRQVSAMKRLAKTGNEAFCGDLARQLEKKGLASHHGDYYERVEWNRVVARLRKVSITGRGREVLTHLQPKEKV